MQHPAVPELAHTDTRLFHWLATAAAIAGVTALSSILQPGSATAAQPAPGNNTKAKTAPTATAPPTTKGVEFPLDCGPVKVKLQTKATGDLDGDGRPETVVVAHCDASMGTPPDGVYVLTHAAGTDRSRIVATLVDPKDRLTVTDFTVRARAVTATLLGYSTADIPSCCPDLKTPAKWQWRDGAFIRSTPADVHSV